MKIKLIVILLLYVTSSFSQKDNREKIIIVCQEYKNINTEAKLFNISNENFRNLKDKHNRENVLFQNVSKNIITIDKLKSLTKQKLKNDGIKDNFIQIYFEKYFKLYVLVKNSICKNESTLYEVEWVLSVTETEVD